MTQEHKNILLKDICARLPYGVKVLCLRDFNHTWYNLEMIDIGDNEVYLTTNESYANRYVEIEDVKPYLFPLSNMTKEQEDEWYEVFIDPLSKRIDRHTRQEDLQLQADAQAFGLEYLLKNHFDVYNLIPLGLANDATGLDIY